MLSERFLPESIFCFKIKPRHLSSVAEKIKKRQSSSRAAGPKGPAALSVRPRPRATLQRAPQCFFIPEKNIAAREDKTAVFLIFQQQSVQTPVSETLQKTTFQKSKPIGRKVKAPSAAPFQTNFYFY